MLFSVVVLCCCSLLLFFVFGALIWLTLRADNCDSFFFFTSFLLKFKRFFARTRTHLHTPHTPHTTTTTDMGCQVSRLVKMQITNSARNTFLSNPVAGLPQPSSSSSSSGSSGAAAGTAGLQAAASRAVDENLVEFSDVDDLQRKNANLLQVMINSSSFFFLLSPFSTVCSFSKHNAYLLLLSSFSSLSFSNKN